MGHKASRLEPRGEIAVGRVEIPHVLEDSVRDDDLHSPLFHPPHTRPGHAVSDHGIRGIGIGYRGADPLYPIGREGALQQPLREYIAGEEVLVQVPVVVGPAEARPSRPPAEEPHELVEHGEVSLPVRIPHDIERMVALDAREERGEPDPERVAGAELGERPRHLLHAVRVQHGEVLHPDLVAVGRRVGAARPPPRQQARNARDVCQETFQ